MNIDQLRSNGIRVTTITDEIHVIHGNNRSRSPFANAILILDRVRALLDTGCGLDITEKLARMLGIETVIVSHSHPDHTAGAWLLQDLSNPDIVVPDQCRESIAQADSFAVRFVEDELAGFWKENYLPVTGFRDFSPTASFTHGHEFSFGTTRFIALHTPGHLDDHYCLYEPEKKIVVGFDIDLSPFGPWYGNPESDIGLFKASIDLVNTLPAEVYISSHAKPVKGAYIYKRLDAFGRAFDERDRTILEVLSGRDWISLEEIVMGSPIYQVDHTEPDRIYQYGETQMVKKHLAGLVEKDLIAERDGQYRLRS